MKLINKKSFYLVLAAILGYWAFEIITMILSLSNIDKAVEDMLNNPVYGGVYAELGEDAIKSTITTSAIMGTLIVVGLSSIFLFKLLGHRKTPKKGTYLTVLLVFACIIGGFSIINLIGGDFSSLVTIAILGLIVAAYAIQKNDNLTPYAASSQPYGANPYGGQPYQPPYGQSPYGQPPQNGQQGPFTGPYQPPQNPYGDPYRPQPPDNKNNR